MLKEKFKKAYKNDVERAWKDFAWRMQEIYGMSIHGYNLPPPINFERPKVLSEKADEIHAYASALAGKVGGAGRRLKRDSIIDAMETHFIGCDLTILTAMEIAAKAGVRIGNKSASKFGSKARDASRKTTIMKDKKERINEFIELSSFLIKEIDVFTRNVRDIHSEKWKKNLEKSKSELA